MPNDPAAIVSNPRPLRVFLCHSSTDKPAVRKLYQLLKADGFEPWFDEENLLPGQKWQRQIPKAVRESDVVIVCLSCGSVNRDGYIQKEIKFALDVADEKPEDAIFIIPLRLEECEVPERLNQWHWVNLFDPNGYKRLLLTFATQFGAKSLPPTIAAQSEEPVATRPQTDETSQSNSGVSNQSGGVNLKANDVAVGQDATGRDKVVSAGGHIIHAEPGSTVIINELAKAVRKKAAQEQRAFNRTAAVAAFNLRLRKIFTRGRIFGGLIAFGVLAGLFVVNAAFFGNNATRISATQTAEAIAALPTGTPTPTLTATPANTPVPMQVDILRSRRTESIAAIDFQVLDNGIPQSNLPSSAFTLASQTGADVPITGFEVHTADDPVCVIAVVDNSGSIAPHVAHIKNALSLLNDKRKSNDQLGLVLFAGAGEVKIQPPSTAALDPEVVIGSGGTALWDGILEGLEQAKSCDPALQRYLFVLTDGDDNQSIFMKEDGLATNVDKAQAVALQAAKMNVGICAIGVNSGDLQEDPLKKVAYGCRNGYQRAADYNEVAALFEQIFGSVRDFYRVQFSPEAFASGRITLHVQGATEVSADFGN
jgi:hypothetical protein